MKKATRESLLLLPVSPPFYYCLLARQFSRFKENVLSLIDVDWDDLGAACRVLFGTGTAHQFPGTRQESIKSVRLASVPANGARIVGYATVVFQFNLPCHNYFCSRCFECTADPSHCCRPLCRREKRLLLNPRPVEFWKLFPTDNASRSNACRRTSAR